MSEHTKLEPCPFCGGEMVVRERSAFHPGTDCWLTTAGDMSSAYELDESDYAAWNRRSPAPAEDGEGLREALKQIALITASGRTTELLAKMAQVNALARAALSSGRDGGKT